MTRAARLPAGFEALDRFVDRWALATAAARADARNASGEAERRDFYDLATPLLPAAIAHLDATPLAAHGPADRRLMALMLSLAHVSLAVEMQGIEEPCHALSARAMPITRAPSDMMFGAATRA